MNFPIFFWAYRPGIFSQCLITWVSFVKKQQKSSPAVSQKENQTNLKQLMPRRQLPILCIVQFGNLTMLVSSLFFRRESRVSCCPARCALFCISNSVECALLFESIALLFFSEPISVPEPRSPWLQNPKTSSRISDRDVVKRLIPTNRIKIVE